MGYQFFSIWRFGTPSSSSFLSLSPSQHQPFTMSHLVINPGNGKSTRQFNQCPIKSSVSGTFPVWWHQRNDSWWFIHPTKKPRMSAIQNWWCRIEPNHPQFRKSAGSPGDHLPISQISQVTARIVSLECQVYTWNILIFYPHYSPEHIPISMVYN